MVKFSNYVIAALMLTTLLIACKDQDTQKQRITEQQKQVDSMLATADVLSPEQKAMIDELIHSYETFAEKYPDDSLGAAYLFEAARLETRKPDFEKAIAMFRKVAEKYPNDDLAPKSLLSIGGIYDVTLHDYKNAETAYRELLEKYPRQAQEYGIDMVLKTLGKSPDEILKELQSANGQAADTSAVQSE